MLLPSLQQQHRPHYAQCEHHIHAAGIGGAKHLEAGETDEGGHERRASVPAAGVEEIHAKGQHNGSQRTGETRHILVHPSRQRTAGRHTPVHEGWLVGNLPAVVMRHHPVVLRQHRLRHYRFARLSFGMKVRQSQPGKRHHDRQEKQHIEVSHLLRCNIHSLSLFLQM